MLLDDEVVLLSPDMLKRTGVPIAYELYSVLINTIRNFINIPFRMFPLFFGLLTIYFTFYLAKKLYDEKTALLSAFIMSILFYHIWASLQFQPDGSLTPLLVLSAVIAYMKYDEKHNKNWLFMSSLLFFVAMCFKYVAVIITPILLTYEFSKPSKERGVKNVVVVSLMSFLMFLTYPITAFVLGKPEIFLKTIRWGIQNTAYTGFSFPKVFIKNIYSVLQYATPLLVLLPLMALWGKDKKDYPLFTWVFSMFFLLLFVIPNAPVARHQMFLIIPLSILTAKEIIKVLKYEDKKFIFITMFLMFLVLFGLFFTLNTHSQTKTPFTFSQLNPSLLPKNPDIWYSGFSGPLFRVSSFTFFFTLLSSVGVFLLYIILRDQRFGLILFICLISISFAFNSILIIELFSYGSSPNYNQIMKNMIGYYEDNRLPEPIYSKYDDIPYYMGVEYHSAKNPENLKIIKNNGGTVMWLNLPPIFKGGPLWRTLENIRSTCELEKTFYSKGYEAGYIFICNKEQEES